MIITGCQRSGTRSIATAFGCRHEEQFDVFTTHSKLAGKKIYDEASWLAVPFLDLLTSVNVSILHLVRHPFDVINSMHQIDFWHPHRYKLYADFASFHMPGLDEIEDPIDKSIYYYIHWNEKLHAHPRIRLEDFANLPHENTKDEQKTQPPLSPECLTDTDKLEGICQYYGYRFNSAFGIPARLSDEG